LQNSLIVPLRFQLKLNRWCYAKWGNNGAFYSDRHWFLQNYNHEKCYTI